MSIASKFFYKPSWLGFAALKPGFLSSKPNWLWFQATYLLAPLIYRFCKLKIEIDPSGAAHIQAIERERCLVLPNHPAAIDAVVVIRLSQCWQRYTFCWVAREMFSMVHGFLGYVLQRLGCYSVMRGAIDRNALSYTRKILRENRATLLVFPEGQISYRYDSLLPLEDGIFQLALSAMKDLVKQYGPDLATVPSLYVIPTAIRYDYNPSEAQCAIQKSLTQLENALDLPLTTETDFKPRVHRLFEALISPLSTPVKNDLDSHDTSVVQLGQLYGLLVDYLTEALQLPPAHQLSFLDQGRRIRNILETSHQGAPHYVAFKKMLQDAIYLHAIDEAYHYAEATQEKLDAQLALVTLLEMQVFGCCKLSYWKTAHVTPMPPIDLKTYWQHDDALEALKQAVANALLSKIQT